MDVPKQKQINRISLHIVVDKTHNDTMKQDKKLKGAEDTASIPVNSLPIQVYLLQSVTALGHTVSLFRWLGGAEFAKQLRQNVWLL